MSWRITNSDASDGRNIHADSGVCTNDVGTTVVYANDVCSSDVHTPGNTAGTCDSGSTFDKDGIGSNDDSGGSEHG